MPVPAVRFNPLDKDFSAPMKSIKTSDPAVILNDSSNSISSTASDFTRKAVALASDLNVNNIVSRLIGLKNSAQNATGILKFLNSVGQAQSSIRQVRGLYRSTLDVNSSALKNLDKIRDRIFGNDPIKDKFTRVIDADYGGNQSKNNTTGKPYRPVVKAPIGTAIPPGSQSAIIQGKPNINYTALVKGVQSLTGNDAYQYTVVDQNLLVQQAVFIANSAYEAGLTGIMLIIQQIPGMTPEMLARITAIVMTEQASRGNSSAILDMSQGTTSVLDGQSPLYANPAILTDILSNFVSPSEMTGSTTLSVSDALFDSMEQLDPRWNVSDIDGIPSTKHFVTGSEDLFNVLKTKALNHVFDESSLMNVFGSPDDAIVSAMIASNHQNLLSLKTLGSRNSCSSTFCNC